MLLQSGLFAGIFTLMIAMIVGAFWWMETPDNAIRMNTMSSPSAKPQPADAVPPRQTASNTLADRKDDGPIAIAGIPTKSAGSLASSGSNQSEMGQYRTISMPETQSASSIASAANSRRKASVSTLAILQKKQARPDQKKRHAPRRNNIVGGGERANEISRLKAQAFAETRKTASAVPNPRKKSGPEAWVDQSSGKRTSSNAGQLARRVNLAHEFNQCKRKASFLQREKCKWDICAGNWGMNGCPTYKHDIAGY
ncbi:MAG: hypothetical protein A3I66_09220 [Burkholderiales bacterium RIFCSPLOWO2_02_FULL_57_36]|nr:MAG: hypothetical protein A3I66_09220 [Burkholderiales bacterium RIFCSPLOWO2_02_FULL_57_36]